MLMTVSWDLSTRPDLAAKRSPFWVYGFRRLCNLSQARRRLSFPVRLAAIDRSIRDTVFRRPVCSSPENCAKQGIGCLTRNSMTRVMRGPSPMRLRERLPSWGRQESASPMSENDTSNLNSKM